MSVRLAAVAAACLACGKTLPDADGGVGADAASWGVACHDPAVLSTPPSCDPNDGGADAANGACQQWADQVANGASGSCAGSACYLQMVPPTCEPSANGDAICQAWFQSYAKSAHAYGICSTSNGHGFQCVAANVCPVQGANVNPECACGSTSGASGCGYGKPGPAALCVDVGGTPTCAAWCQ